MLRARPRQGQRRFDAFAGNGPENSTVHVRGLGFEQLGASLLFGAIITSTDSTAVATLFKELGAPKRLNILAQGENLWSFYSPQIHQLGGSSSNTTLVVIDGMRMPGGGAQFAQTDPNVIPTSAMQRIDVLADGASSVYGSDAVAGVVNFVTRRTFEGLQIGSSYGSADSYDKDRKSTRLNSSH